MVWRNSTEELENTPLRQELCAQSLRITSTEHTEEVDVGDVGRSKERCTAGLSRACCTERAAAHLWCGGNSHPRAS